MSTATLQRKVGRPGLIKAEPTGSFRAYPSTFVRQADAYGDVVHRNAFDATLENWRASGNTMPGLFGHRMDDPQMYVAGADDYGTDDTGWWVEGKFDLDNPVAEQVHRLVVSKRLNQLSFAYNVLDQGEVELADGSTANELRQLDVFEFSFVPVGANPTTFVESAKSHRATSATDRSLRLRLELLARR